MRLNFRQGIIKYPTSSGVQDFLRINGSYVDLNADNGVVEASLAHGMSNYLHSENSTVLTAWGPFIPTTDYWLYWDIDQVTGIRTFGHTEVEPVVQSTKPLLPILGMHWFDISTNTMRVYTNGVWRPNIRVFACKYDGSSTITPISIGVTNFPFAGTQVGLNNNPNFSGRIVFDDTGLPIKKAAGEFFTAEDQFFVSGSRVNSVRLESTITNVKAAQLIPAFHVVKYTQFNEVQLAEYNDTGTTVVAVAVENIAFGETGAVVVQGVVTNTLWSWDEVGVPLWIDTSGQFTSIDPNITNNILHPKSKVPVARVLSYNSIIFEQGLGGKGEKGDAAIAGAIELATEIVPGLSRLSTAPVSAIDPIVVGNNDVRMADARTPLSHIHTANTVTVTPTGSIIASDAQAALAELDTNKLSLTGGTLTGTLQLSSDPSGLLDAATKNYVDSLVTGLIWIEPIRHVNMISDSLTTPPITPVYSDLYVVATGGTGAWVGMDGKVVQWDGAAWVDLGLLSAFPTGTRIGVALETINTPTGTFVGKENNIAVLDNPAGPTWSFVVPAANEALFVNNELSLHAYHQFVYDAVNLMEWIEFGGTQPIQAGTNLIQVGNILNVVDYASGGTIEAETLQGSVPGDFAATVHSHANANAYDIAATILGIPVADDVVLAYIAPRSFSLDNGATSQAYAEIASTGSAVFDILKNGVSIGSLTFNISQTGVFSLTPTAFIAGDRLTITAPSIPDATLEDIYFTIIGTLA